MKIAQVVSTFPPYKGGIGNVAYHYSKELVRLGHKVFVFTPKYKEVDFIEEDFKVERLRPWLKFGNAAFLPQLFWRLKDFDIIHLHYPFFGGAEIIWLLKKIKGKKLKLVISYHMDVIGKGFVSGFFRFHTRFIMPRILRSADKIVCASFDYTKESNIKDIFEKQRNKFVEIPFGVDLDIFRPTEKDLELIKKYNLKSDDKVILFVGGLDKAHYFKGVDILIKSVKKINRADVKLLIVGKGDLSDEYKRLAKKLEIDNLVIFEGESDYSDLAKYYNLSDFLILPSIDKSEAFGLVLIEAMACAKPVIGSNLAGARGVVGTSGLLVEPKNLDDLVEKIKDLLDNKEKINLLGKDGLNRVRDIYNWPRAVKNLNKLYEDLSDI